MFFNERVSILRLASILCLGWLSACGAYDGAENLGIEGSDPLSGEAQGAGGAKSQLRRLGNALGSDDDDDTTYVCYAGSCEFGRSHSVSSICDRNCPGASFFAGKLTCSNTVNSTFCEANNTDKFNTCDVRCPPGYEQVGGRTAFASCHNGYVTCEKVKPTSGSVCGNGRVEQGETCDDGWTNTNKSCKYGDKKCNFCTNSCKRGWEGGLSYCGDGKLDSGNGEQCDDGPSNTPGLLCESGAESCDVCTDSCKKRHLGPTATRSIAATSNHRGIITRSDTCPIGGLVGVKVAEQRGNGVVDMMLICERGTSSSPTSEWILGNFKDRIYHTETCSGNQFGLAAQEQDGYGVVDVKLACSAPSSLAATLALTGNSRGTTRHTIHCADNHAVGLEVKEQPGHGVTNYKLICDEGPLVRKDPPQSSTEKRRERCWNICETELECYLKVPGCSEFFYLADL